MLPHAAPISFRYDYRMRTDLVLDALRMALAQREPGADFELVAHTDRGSQYTSADYTQELNDHGVLSRSDRSAAPMTNIGASTRWPRERSPSNPVRLSRMRGETHGARPIHQVATSPDSSRRALVFSRASATVSQVRRRSMAIQPRWLP